MKKWWNWAEKIGLIAIIALIPTQLGRHWWPEWSLVGGIRVDYLSPTLYLIDVVWLGWTAARMAGGKWREFGVKWWWVALALINIAVAGNKWAAVEGWARWWQWWTVIRVAADQRQEVKKALMRIVPFWVLVEAGLSLAQVVGGGNVGGIFYWLGERRFSLNSVGSALWSVDGEEWVRAMGTFSHPNSLAGFTLLLAGWWWSIRDSWRKTRWGLALGVAVGAGMGIIMVLTASRTVWVVAAGAGLWAGIKYGKLKEKIGWTAIVAGGVILLVGVIGREYEMKNFFGGWDDGSAQKRLELAGAAKEMIGARPITGVGMKNWWNEQVKTEFRAGGWRQPVHNVVGLGWAETGLVGMVLTLVTIGGWMRNKPRGRWVWALGIIGLTGMVDHYWITLPQNRWLWGLILAII